MVRAILLTAFVFLLVASPVSADRISSSRRGQAHHLQGVRFRVLRGTRGVVVRVQVVRLGGKRPVQGAVPDGIERTTAIRSRFGSVGAEPRCVQVLRGIGP
jgi:hypothetical protein